VRCCKAALTIWGVELIQYFTSYSDNACAQYACPANFFYQLAQQCIEVYRDRLVALNASADSLQISVRIQVLVLQRNTKSIFLMVSCKPTLTARRRFQENWFGW
jgi:hypothetical protein